MFERKPKIYCPFRPETICNREECEIWITTDSGGMCSISLIATSLKGLFTLCKKSKSEIDKYFENAEQGLDGK